MDFTDIWKRNSRYPFEGLRRRRRLRNYRQDRRRYRQWGTLLLLIAVILFIIYLIFFHIHNVGRRAVVVNDENVESMDGFVVFRSTWVSRNEAERFLTRIHATNVSMPSATKSYQGQSYIRISDLAHTLTLFGDPSTFRSGQLTVQLKPSQHYSYATKGDLVRQQEVWDSQTLLGRWLSVYHDEAYYIPVSQIVTFLNQSHIAAAWNGSELDVAVNSPSGAASVAPGAPAGSGSNSASDSNSASSATSGPSAAQGPANLATPTVMKPKDYTLIRYGNGGAIFAPQYVWQNTTYLPAYSVAAVLRQIGYGTSLAEWKLTWALGSTRQVSGAGDTGGTVSAGLGTVPPAARKHEPTVLGFVPFYYGDLASFHDVLQNPRAYNALAEDVWTVDASGRLSGGAPAGSAGEAQAAGDTVYAMVTNLGSAGMDANAISTILNDKRTSGRLDNEIVGLVDSEGLDGAMLDFETIPATDRVAYSDFVTRLANDLHAHGRLLSVVVPPDTGATNEPWNGAYDQALLGQVADSIVVMAYDYSYAGGPAGPIAPMPWVEETLAYTVSRVPANKVILGVDAYGYDWANKHGTAVGLTSVVKFLADHHITPKWDNKSQAPWYTWTDSQGVKHEVWYENAVSTSAKLKASASYGVDGIALWRAGLEDSSVLRVLADYARGGYTKVAPLATTTATASASRAASTIATVATTGHVATTGNVASSSGAQTTSNAGQSTGAGH